jgi:hypothetical protein
MRRPFNMIMIAVLLLASSTVLAMDALRGMVIVVNPDGHSFMLKPSACFCQHIQQCRKAEADACRIEILPAGGILPQWLAPNTPVDLQGRFTDAQQARFEAITIEATRCRQRCSDPSGVRCRLGRFRDGKHGHGHGRGGSGGGE